MLETKQECAIRAEVGEKLSLPKDSPWEIIYRLYLCRCLGIQDDTNWDDLWRTLWCRYLSLPDDSASQLLQRTCIVRGIDRMRDPCNALVTYATLTGLGLRVDTALMCPGLASFLTSVTSDYNSWRSVVLRR